MEWLGKVAGGTARRQFLVVFAMVAVVGGLIWSLVRSGAEHEGELRVACAAGMRRPMVEIARAYEEEYGVKVALQFGGSGALAGQLEVAGGDLYFPADEEYFKPLIEKGLVRGSWAVVELRAGLVVSRGNPKGLVTLADLGREGVRVSLANRSAAIGRLTWGVLEESGLLKGLEGNILVTKPTVNEVVEDVALGAVDATLAWDAVAAGYEAVQWSELKGVSGLQTVAAIAVLGSSHQPERAVHFAKYVANAEKGGRIFREMGFDLAVSRVE